MGSPKVAALSWKQRLNKEVLLISSLMINYWAWLSLLGFLKCWVFDDFFSVVAEGTKVGSC